MPQQKVGEQSLWSYGATYSTGKNLCQVRQKKFYIDYVDSQAVVKLVDDMSRKDLASFFLLGNFSFFIAEKKYSSFYIKEVAPGFVHVHCRKSKEND